MKSKCKHKFTRNIVSNNTTHYAFKRCTNCGKFVSWVPKGSILSIDLDVPYSDKEEAKRLGAFWDSNAGTWFAPNMNKTMHFKDWLDVRNLTAINQRLEEYKKEHILPI